MTSVPGYWMHEQGGELQPAVRAYLAGHELGPGELRVIRAYLRQWMAGDFRGAGVAELAADVELIGSSSALRHWLGRAFELGIDPL